MFKLIKTFPLALLFSFSLLNSVQIVANEVKVTQSATAQQFEFKEGVHFEIVKDVAKSEQKKVTEFFSYFCGHCFKFEPVALALEKSLPKGVTFEKSHVNFLGGVPKALQDELSRAYLIAKQKGKDKKASELIFDAIHVKRANLSVDLVPDILNQAGVKSDSYAQMASNMVINADLQTMQEQQGTYSSAQTSQGKPALTGVPTFFVNDKYKVLLNVRSQQEFEALIAYLLDKE